MRRSRVCTLQLPVLLIAFLVIARSHAQTLPSSSVSSLQSELSRELPNLQNATANIRGVYERVVTKTMDLDPATQPTIQQGRSRIAYAFSAADGCAKAESIDARTGEATRVLSRTPGYQFELRKRGELLEPSRFQRLDSSADPPWVEFDELRSPLAAYVFNATSLARLLDPATGRIERVHEDGEGDTRRISLDIVSIFRASDGQTRKIPATLTLDPSHHLAIIKAVETQQFKTETTIVYFPHEPDVAVPQQMTTLWFDGEGREIQREEYTFEHPVRNDLQPREFEMSAYGFPEPQRDPPTTMATTVVEPNAAPSRMWIVSLLALAAAIVALLFTRQRKRI